MLLKLTPYLIFLLALLLACEPLLEETQPAARQIPACSPESSASQAASQVAAKSATIEAQGETRYYLRTPITFIASNAAADGEFKWRVERDGQVVCLSPDDQTRALAAYRQPAENSTDSPGAPPPLSDGYTFATSQNQISLAFEEVGEVAVLLEYRLEGKLHLGRKEIRIVAAGPELKSIQVFNAESGGWIGPNNNESISVKRGSTVRIRVKTNFERVADIPEIYWQHKNASNRTFQEVRWEGGGRITDTSFSYPVPDQQTTITLQASLSGNFNSAPSVTLQVGG